MELNEEMVIRNIEFNLQRTADALEAQVAILEAILKLATQERDERDG